jgi:hypothetical protein
VPHARALPHNRVPRHHTDPIARCRKKRSLNSNIEDKRRQETLPACRQASNDSRGAGILLTNKGGCAIQTTEPVRPLVNPEGALVAAVNSAHSLDP